MESVSGLNKEGSQNKINIEPQNIVEYSNGPRAINKDPTFYIMKYYITQTVVEEIDGKLHGREVILTRADSRVDNNSALLVNIVNFKKRLERLGIKNLHINKYDKKRYNKLMREQNKYRKTVKLTMADLAKMTEQAEELGGDNV